jgi:hypothetical protein
VATWVIEPVPPEMAEEFQRTFDDAAFVADMEEALKTGGADIDAPMYCFVRARPIAFLTR